MKLMILSALIIVTLDTASYALGEQTPLMFANDRWVWALVSLMWGIGTYRYLMNMSSYS